MRGGYKREVCELGEGSGGRDLEGDATTSPHICSSDHSFGKSFVFIRGKQFICQLNLLSDYTININMFKIYD